MIAPDCLRRMTRTGALLPASLRPADDTDLDPEPREPWPVPVPAFLPGASLDDGTAATDPPPAHWSPPDDRFAPAPAARRRPRPQPLRMKESTMFTERTRAYVYRVALAALFVAGGYDVLTDDQVMLWTALVAAVLAVPLAVANTSTTTEG